MKHSLQMSETLRLGIILALSGGFMDAYSYLERGNVFANAQTGNLLLFGVNLAEGNYFAMLSYLLPVLAFTLGILLADTVRCLNIRLHWRQLSVLLEAVILICAEAPLAAGCSAGRNPDLIYSRFPANRIQYAGKCHGIFRLCNAGTVLPQGKRIFLCKYYVYRKLKKRNRESAPLSANP
mgnify:CR=1 FL=1